MHRSFVTSARSLALEGPSFISQKPPLLPTAQRRPLQKATLYTAHPAPLRATAPPPPPPPHRRAANQSPRTR